MSEVHGYEREAPSTASAFERIKTAFWRASSHAAVLAAGLALGAHARPSNPPRRDDIAHISGVEEAAKSAAAKAPIVASVSISERPDPLAATVAKAPLSPREIAERARASTVYLRAGDYYGSGVVVARDGLVLTCAHVIEGTGPVRVLLLDGTEYVATIVDRDERLDLALLQIAATDLTPIPLGDPSELRTGDEVFAFGAPRKMAFSMSRGLVSFARREIDGIQYLQTDLPLNGGSSGGPVVNIYGEAVAIASFVLKQSQGLSFALPLDYATKRFAARLNRREHGR